jgi:hypothetical protein
MRPGYDNPRVSVLSRIGERLGRRWIDVAPVYLKVEAIPLCVVPKPVPYISIHPSLDQGTGKATKLHFQAWWGASQGLDATSGGACCLLNGSCVTRKPYAFDSSSPVPPPRQGVFLPDMVSFPHPRQGGS